MINAQIMLLESEKRDKKKNPKLGHIKWCPGPPKWQETSPSTRPMCYGQSYLSIWQWGESYQCPQLHRTTQPTIWQIIYVWPKLQHWNVRSWSKMGGVHWHMAQYLISFSLPPLKGTRQLAWMTSAWRITFPPHERGKGERILMRRQDQCDILHF